MADAGGSRRLRPSQSVGSGLAPIPDGRHLSQGMSPVAAYIRVHVLAPDPPEVYRRFGADAPAACRERVGCERLVRYRHQSLRVRSDTVSGPQQSPRTRAGCRVVTVVLGSTRDRRRPRSVVLPLQFSTDRNGRPSAWPFDLSRLHQPPRSASPPERTQVAAAGVSRSRTPQAMQDGELIERGRG